MKNSIAERITDFIKQYPPFSYLSLIDLYVLGSEANVIYLEKDETLYAPGHAPHELFYIVHQGAVKLYRQEENQVFNVEICDEGDVFGLKPLIVNENYSLTAKAFEETIVYGLPIEIFKSQFENNPQISKYLITKFASSHAAIFTLEDNSKIFSDYKRNNHTDYFSTQIKNIMLPAVVLPKESTLKTTANYFTSENTQTIFITNANKHPIGVVTPKDLITKAFDGKHLMFDAIANIMHTPVQCCSTEISIADVQLIMLKHKISTVCITENGTHDSKIVGMVTQDEIIATLSNNPAILLKQIGKANNINQLRELRQELTNLLSRFIHQKISFTHSITVVAELNEAILYKCVDLTLKTQPHSPPTQYAFFTLGSQARKEQMTPTDQDHGIIFKNEDPTTLVSERAYFLEFANEIAKNLKTIGFEFCNADMMANNPKWCLSENEWRNQFKEWIYQPNQENILLSSIFFDFNFLYGDSYLVDEMSEMIYEHTQNNFNFFTCLVRDALKNPSPIGFFRQFIVEHNGEYKDHFNIKQRAIIPLINAARILTLQHHLKGINNTAERFYQLRDLEPKNAAIYEACAYAFKALLKFKVENELDHIYEKDGKYLALDKLSKEQKLKLRRCFKPLENIQQILSSRYHTYL